MNCLQAITPSPQTLFPFGEREYGLLICVHLWLIGCSAEILTRPSAAQDDNDLCTSKRTYPVIPSEARNLGWSSIGEGFFFMFIIDTR
ncbi:MAG: hypothetical protein PWQ55_1282 [Chloroflexota bacterium]|nr:hypothetical protein [Chloroflexota bacterium]